MARTAVLNGIKIEFLQTSITDVTAFTAGALTDNSAGTANDTLQAMPDPTDSPADVDALRDDLVATLLPAVRNNVADLAAKVNALITFCESAEAKINAILDALDASKTTA